MRLRNAGAERGAQCAVGRRRSCEQEERDERHQAPERSHEDCVFRGTSSLVGGGRYAQVVKDL